LYAILLLYAKEKGRFMLKYFKSIQQIYIPGSVNPGQELRFGP
jgi:hypothetical protein